MNFLPKISDCYHWGINQELFSGFVDFLNVQFVKEIKKKKFWIKS